MRGSVKKIRMELNWLEGFQQALRAHEKEKVFEKGEKKGEI